MRTVHSAVSWYKRLFGILEESNSGRKSNYEWKVQGITGTCKFEVSKNYKKITDC